jgi:hypothetical protein
MPERYFLPALFPWNLIPESSAAAEKNECNFLIEISLANICFYQLDDYWF